MNQRDLPEGYYYNVAGIQVGKWDSPNPYSDLCFVAQTVNWRMPSIDEIVGVNPMTYVADKVKSLFPWKELTAWP